MFLTMFLVAVALSLGLLVVVFAAFGPSLLHLGEWLFRGTFPLGPTDLTLLRLPGFSHAALSALGPSLGVALLVWAILTALLYWFVGGVPGLSRADSAVEDYDVKGYDVKGYDVKGYDAQDNDWQQSPTGQVLRRVADFDRERRDFEFRWDREVDALSALEGRKQEFTEGVSK